MRPEAALHLAKSRKLLDTARNLLRDHYINDAARVAYLAAFHAAQAFIVEHVGRAAKTHAGAHSQFGQLSVHEPKISAEIGAFLPKAFKLKTIVDYEYGEGSDIPPERAADAVEKAGRFVERITSVLEKPDHEAPAQTAARKRKE